MADQAHHLYRSFTRDSGGTVVSGPGIEKIFAKPEDAYIYEAELKNAYAQGRVSRDEEVFKKQAQFDELRMMADDVMKRAEELKAESERYKKALEDIVKIEYGTKEGWYVQRAFEALKGA